MEETIVLPGKSLPASFLSIGVCRPSFSTPEPSVWLLCRPIQTLPTPYGVTGYDGVFGALIG